MIPRDPHGNPPEEHDNHHVCPLAGLRRRKAVGHWIWNDICQNLDWYETEILPAFQQFRHERRQREQRQRLERKRQQELADSQVDDISGAMGALGCKFKSTCCMSGLTETKRNGRCRRWFLIAGSLQPTNPAG